MIERLLRLLFKAPTAHVTFTEDDTLPENWVTVDSKTMAIIGIEPLDEAMLYGDTVVVGEDDNCCAASNLIGIYGHGPHPLRRRVMNRLVRHLIGGAWTLAGMVIVLLTLSGAVQIISLVVCLLFFMVDLMSISLRRP